MLFDLARDATEVHDLAASHRDKLAELVAAFDADAFANYVYPLDNRGVRRSLTVPPFLEDAHARPRTFVPGSTVALGVVAPLVNDRAYRLLCTFQFAPGDEGVLFALGDLLGGMALYARDGALVFVYRGGQGGEVACDGVPVRPGTNRFELRHEALGERVGRGTIAMNGERVATVDMSPTTILGLGVGEGLDVGVDRKLPVSERYAGGGAWPYTGRVECVMIEPGAQAPDSYANLPERIAQNA
jgi:arylsulfatase